MMISIILVEPETPGNVGAVARVMKNFGHSQLYLINPRCDHLDKDAVDRATSAKRILEKAVVCDWNVLDKFSLIVGTSAKLGTDYNIRRSPVLPEELASRLDIKGKVALVFGRESSGLLNSEVENCDFLVTIPSDRKSPVLNLSHAVAIILYELHKRECSDQISRGFPGVSSREKKELLDAIGRVIDSMEFSTPEKRMTQRTVWAHVLGKSLLTKREAFALLGFFKKLR